MSNRAYADHQHGSRNAAPDRRGAPRALAVYKVVKIKRDDKEGLARCRNISETGMKLEVGMQLSLNDHLKVELSPDIVLDARVVWTNGNECGVAFERHIDCEELLGQSLDFKRKERSRSPRLNTHIPARIALQGAVHPTTIKNISQRGMLVTHNGKFNAGLRVRVLMPNGDERDALVQWVHENFAGLLLAEPFGVLDLSDVQSLS